MNQYGKATVSGLTASLAMFIVMFIGIHVTGIAPFNVPPSAAFLETLGLNVGPVPLLVHFGYGAFWSVVLVGIVGSSANLKNGIGLAVGLWLVMMLALSPLIGWGVFGQSPSVPTGRPQVCCDDLRLAPSLRRNHRVNEWLSTAGIADHRHSYLSGKSRH